MAPSKKQTNTKTKTDKQKAAEVYAGAFGDRGLDRLNNLAGDAPMMAAALAKGITPEFLIDRALKELGAMETKFFAHEGVVKDERDVVAWGVRQKARMDLQKALGLYPVEQKEILLNADGLRLILDSLPEDVREKVKTQLLNMVEEDK